MKRSLLVFLVGIAAFAVGALVGFYAGQGSAFTYLEMEVVGTLNLHVEVLSRLRSGNEAGAIEELEMTVNRAVINLPQNQPVSELPERTKRALGLAKLYRTAYNPDVTGAQMAWSVLEEVPTRPVPTCSPALQEVLQNAGR
ncbi:MAG: hypothetical protein GY856_14915 [bacterium]|nr:hypothetical protein [bacterium]